MELLLNTFWLLIAVGALGIWIRQWRRGAKRRDLPLQLFALGCVLVFLLPVISASDDLHATALAVEASGFSRKILKSITPSGTSVNTWRHVLPAVLGFISLVEFPHPHPAEPGSGSAAGFGFSDWVRSARRAVQNLFSS